MNNTEPRRRYILSGRVDGARFVVTVHRGRRHAGQVIVLNVGAPDVTAWDEGMGELPADHRAALVLLASRGFTGSWSPAGRAPSTTPDRAHRTPLR